MRHPLPVRRAGGAGEWLGIGEVAASYGVTLRALRFYESRGLLSPRREGTQRLYGPRDRVRLELVLKGKRLGFSLIEIIDLVGRVEAEGSDGAAPTGDLALSAEELRRQIGVLEYQHRAVEAALAELRRRYYLLGEVVPGALEA